MSDPIIVVGAGQAAASLIAKMRALGHGGPITLIGAEPVAPYQRPPLSKKYLLGEMARDRLLLRPETWYADQGVTCLFGTRVAEIDRAAKAVVLADGARLTYDKLALTLDRKSVV